MRPTEQKDGKLPLPSTHAINMTGSVFFVLFCFSQSNHCLKDSDELKPAGDIGAQRKMILRTVPGRCCLRALSVEIVHDADKHCLGEKNASSSRLRKQGAHTDKSQSELCNCRPK